MKFFIIFLKMSWTWKIRSPLSNWSN